MPIAPFITVVIPTRERADTLASCLRSVVTQDYERLNIIVSDNFSADNTEEVAGSFHDSRITYLNTGKRLGMSRNWEFALNHVREGWVVFIGDDDALLPGALTIVAAAIAETKGEAIISPASYFNWPGSLGVPGQLLVPTGKGIVERSSKRWLALAMKGAVPYTELPILYNGGFVKTTAISRARHSDGSFFRSMTPDVYSGIAIALVTNSYFKLGRPVFLAGASAHSTGASWFKGNGKDNPSELYFAEDNLPCHPRLVTCKVKSIPILTYECYLQAQHLQTEEQFSLADQLRRAMVLAEPKHRDSVRKYCNNVAANNNLSLRHTLLRMWPTLLRRNVNRFLSRIRTINVDSREFHISNAHDAASLAETIYILHEKYRRYIWHNIKKLAHDSLVSLTKHSR